MVKILRNLDEAPLAIQLLLATIISLVGLYVVKGPNADFIDLWLSPDQQGRRLFEQVEYTAAAERFENPSWKATAQYRAGNYEGAAESFGRVANAEGLYNRGNAFMKAFDFRGAIASYELATAEAPDWVEAQENLELARYTLDYIERAREASDTGEESGIGADDVVFDNTGERGAETEISRESAVEAQSAEKWMRSVDTETADFLRSRFLLEASRAGDI